jgi:mono/diheme cytochrome c family protein
MSASHRLLLVLAPLALLSACKPAPSEPAAEKLDFVTHVQPILQSACVNCHHDEALLGHLNLQSAAQAFADRPGGPAIVPGKPEASPLYIVLTLPVEEQKAMPPESHRLPAEQVALIRRWIEEGAEWPAGPDGAVRPSPAIRAPQP